MYQSRRSFLTSLASLGAFSGLRAFAAPQGMFSGGTPLLTFAAISDIHIFHPKAKAAGGQKFFEHALEWYRAQNVDAVLVAGDLANYGTVEELKIVGDTWRKVFPENKGADGRPVEKVFITGNHDHDGWGYGTVAHEIYPDDKEFEAQKLVKDYRKHWKMVFDEDYEPIYLKKIGGYTFVGSHWDDGDFAQFGARLKDFVAKHKDELVGDKPFFYVQHPMIKGTVSGISNDRTSDRGSVTTRDVLNEFPNAIAFTGHCHSSIADERSIWQGEFTSINLGCLLRTGFFATKNTPKGGYENARTPGMRKTDPPKVQEAGKARDALKAMGMYPGMSASHHGMLLRVYADRIVIERREFTHDRPVGDDWVIPLPSKDNKPLANAVREAAAKAPEFPANAALEILSSKGRTRGKVEKPCLKLRIPAANAVKGTRAVEYVVEIIPEQGEKLVRAVIANGAELAATSKTAKGGTSCILARDTLPSGRLTFKVYPGECFGHLGKPLEKVFEG